MDNLPVKRTDASHEALAHNRSVDYLRSLRPSPSPGSLTSLTTHGTMRRSMVNPIGLSLSIRTYHFKSMEDDYLVCRTWDGTSDGATDIKIAKATKLRFSIASEVIDGETVNYSDYDTSAQSRLADDGDISETQYIVPRYLVDDVIYAIEAKTFVEDPDSTSDPKAKIKLLEWNNDGRAWAAPDDDA